MTDDWQTTTLGAAGRWVSGGTPSTSTSAYWGGDIPWMSSKSLTEFRVRDSDRRLTLLGTQNGTKLVPKDTILMVVRGMSLKSEFRMGITQREVALSQDLKGLVPRSDLDPAFLAYALQSRTEDVLEMVDEAGHGTGRLQTDRLFALELPVPPRPIQHAIAATLGLLDDKIESNRNAIGKLQELFRLDFDRLVLSSELDWLPLAEIASVTKGVSYKSADLQPSRTSLVTLKSFDRTGGYKPDGLKPYVGPYKPGQVVQPGEVAVAQTDLTQGAEVVGRAVRVPADESADVLVASLDLAIVRPQGDISNEYLLGVLTDEAFRQHCRNRTSGTTVLHLAGDAIPNYEAPVVSGADRDRFTSIAKLLLSRLDSTQREIVRLNSLREALLPELLSGRVRAPLEESLV